MNEPISQQPTASEAILEAARREKLRKIREMGIDPWGSRFDDHQRIGDIRGREGEITVGPADGAKTSVKGDSPIFAETKIGTVPETKIGTVPNRITRPKRMDPRFERPGESCCGVPRARFIGCKSAIGPARSR